MILYTLTPHDYYQCRSDLFDFFLSSSSSFTSSFSILDTVYHFSFSTSLPITLTSPPPTGGTPAVRKGRGTDYHVIHVTGTARDTQRYTVTRDTSNHFLSFTVPPFYFDLLDSRYLLFAEFPLFCYFFPPRFMKNEQRTRVANFLCSLTSVSVSLHYSLPLSNPHYLSLYFFISPLSLPCYSRDCFRGACFASDYYLPRSESTAGLWYTGSMVSRYTPATAAPSSRPLGEPVRSPAASRRRPPPFSDLPPSQLLPRCPLTTLLSGEPCFAAPLVPPPHFAREAPGTYQLSIYRNRFFIGLLGKPRCLITTARLHFERMARPTP